MPPTSRDAFLATVRRSLGRVGAARPPCKGQPSVRVDSEATRNRLERGQLTDQFEEEVKKAHGVVSRVSGPGELAALLGALIEEKGIGKIVRWDTPSLANLDDALAGAGAEVLAINPERDGSSRSDQRAALVEADMGLTEVDYAVADIGSLAMRASGSQSRLASVLPPVHVAVVTPDKIVGSLSELLPLLNSGDGLPSAISLVTGPSRTADIETIRTVGIHGPIELHVVILENERN